MKRRITGARLAWPLFVSPILAAFLGARACAQTLPALEVSPPILPADGVLTLSLPPNSLLTQDRTTLRIALYEHLRPTKLAETKKKFAFQNGRWSTSLRLEADPGSYDFRLVTDDKNRTPLSSIATVLVPGLVREPGWWLLNGSPFVEAPPKDEVLPPADAPLFVPGLKRDNKKFDRKIIRSTSPLKWRVLELPTLREIVEAKDYDYDALTTKLQRRMAEARAKGEREFLGFVVSPEKQFSPLSPIDRQTTEPLKTQGRDALLHLRRIVSTLAPDAALIYGTSFGTGSNEATRAQELEDLSGLCDAIALVPSLEIAGELYPAGLLSWELKVARRTAEEQPNYDLPIFLISPWPRVLRVNENSIPIMPRAVPLESAFSEYWMSGASGGVLIGEDNAVLKISRLVQKNAGLFIGSVTLEDTGIRPLPDSPFLSSAYANPYNEDGATTNIGNLYTSLLLINRIPGLSLLQQKTDRKKPESFMTILGPSLTTDTIEKLTAAAKGGARIYLEGAPKMADEDAERWSTLVGATSKPIAQKTTTMTLDDPWIFGIARGEKVRVMQNVEVSLKPPAPTTEKEKDKGVKEPEKGKDILTEPRVVATLADGSPALIENPIGDGQVLWAPHRVINVQQKKERATQYYGAIAAWQGAGLVRIRSVSGKSTPPIRAAIRRSPKGAWLVGLFNESTQATPIALEADHFAGVALDLASEKELPLRTRGNRSFVDTTLPAGGWRIVALGASRKALDDERFAPRSKAKLK